MAKTLRFGILGCGVIGPIHAAAIASLPDAQLVAVADRDTKRARALAEKYQATAYSDLQEMLDGAHLDVVNICTPSGQHGEQACQAMRSGRHVIVEKPIEITLPAIDEMLRVQRESGVKLAVISQRRFTDAVQRVHGLVEEQALGKLVLGNAFVPWWRSQAYYDSGEWRGTWALDGGGVLMNQSIHSIDLLQWLLGPVSRISAYTDTLAHNMETEDVAVAVLRFVNGALGTIAATTSAYPGVSTRIELCGTQGSAVIEDDTLSYLYLAREHRQEAVGAYGTNAAPRKEVSKDNAARNPGDLSYRSHALQIADMLRAIREDGTPLVDGYAARHPVEIILGIYEAARTHQEVRLS
ncbi:MAG: Gfo/Idh/MocA family oxidoreductase [Ktedonobacteraceae bacterium]|nr:Gfo/Idh/MocA family oxidoreductase [Ktedonobacteraceae bacterium]